MTAVFVKFMISVEGTQCPYLPQVTKKPSYAPLCWHIQEATEQSVYMMIEEIWNCDWKINVSSGWKDLKWQISAQLESIIRELGRKHKCVFQESKPLFLWKFDRIKKM